MRKGHMCIRAAIQVLVLQRQRTFVPATNLLTAVKMRVTEETPAS